MFEKAKIEKRAFGATVVEILNEFPGETRANPRTVDALKVENEEKVLNPKSTKSGDDKESFRIRKTEIEFGERFTSCTKLSPLVKFEFVVVVSSEEVLIVIVPEVVSFITATVKNDPVPVGGKEN